MTVSTIKMTANQFLQLGEDPPGVRLELVDGEVAVHPTPPPKHSYAVTRLIYILLDYVERNDLGQVFANSDTIFADYDVRRPDLVFFGKDRLHLITELAMEGPPDLCVEVVSSSSVTIDRETKFKFCEKSTVAHYWIVDPGARTIEGYKLTGGKYRLNGKGKNDDVVQLAPFGDFDIKLHDLWWPR